MSNQIDQITSFHNYCKAVGVKGCIDVSKYEYVSNNILMITAQVFIGDKLVGSDIAGVAIDLDDISYAGKMIVDTATIAKRRALINAGFGIDGMRTPVQTDEQPIKEPGIVPRPIPETGFDNNPTPVMEISEVNKNNTQRIKPPRKKAVIVPTPVDETKPVETKPVDAKPAETEPVETAPVETEPDHKRSTMSLEEAQSFVIPMGTMKGKTLGEVILLNKGIVEYWAGKGSEKFVSAARYPELVASCQRLLEEIAV